MNYRTLFHEIMSYGAFERMPVIHWAEWKETRERWIDEGLPPGIKIHNFLNAHPFWIPLIDDKSWLSVGSEKDDINIGLFPCFEKDVIEENDNYIIFRSEDGVILKDWKNKTSMPHYMEFTLKNAKSWEEYKKRLLPDPKRIAKDIDQRLKKKFETGLPICFAAGSLTGWIRNWMGVENMSYLMFDDRDVYSDMVMTIAELTCWGLDQILPKVKVDLAHSWEDICGRAGPLISPDIFNECVAPAYNKIRNKLDEYGVKYYSIDCDGDITDLIEYWFESGVNVLFPLEVGPFKGDAVKIRKKFGKSLRLMGNFDKMALEKGKSAVEAEIERLMPLMKEGGYIILPDHHITPGVPLDMYRWYLERIRGLQF